MVLDTLFVHTPGLGNWIGYTEEIIIDNRLWISHGAIDRTGRKFSETPDKRWDLLNGRRRASWTGEKRTHGLTLLGSVRGKGCMVCVLLEQQIGHVDLVLLIFVA